MLHRPLLAEPISASTKVGVEMNEHDEGQWMKMAEAGTAGAVWKFTKVKTWITFIHFVRV